MGLFGAEEEEEDNYKLLPPHLWLFYQNPYRAFGLDESTATTTTLRETFRKVCLMFVPYFSGLGTSKMTLEQIIFSYHLIRGSLPRGNAKKLLKELSTSPYLDFRADDILPLLRPMRSTFVCPKEYRGFRMLGVTLLSTRIEYGYVKMPKIVFTFDVHYCMRKSSIDKVYRDFEELHEQFSGELLMLPVLPTPSYWQLMGLESVEVIGKQLATYVMRVHTTLANKKLFSPRLLRFLGIDFERVQSEEEGALMAMLDTPNNPPNTHYHIISEEWLAKWRRFVMGRGARRYVPPGKITNQHLLDQSRLEGRKTLKLAKQYRCVNFNVWRLYELTHGGGPNICRKEEDIYGRFGWSHLQAVIKIQTLIRVFLAKCLRRRLFTKEFSTRQVAKMVIRETMLKDLKESAEETIKREQMMRTEDKLKAAATFTQAMWRNKKSYVPESSLQRRLADQDVFARVADSDGAPAGDDGLVVTDVHSIVQIGTTNLYTWTITKEEGKVPFKLKRLPCSEEAIVADTENEQIVNGSKIVSINSYPASSMTYKELKAKLVKVDWPLILELERPLKNDQIPTLDLIMGMDDPTLQYNGFKILLSNGLVLIKHNSGNKKAHITTIRITDRHFYYKSKHNPQKIEEDMWNGFSLFNLKFMLNGEQSETIQKKSAELNVNHCFEVVNETRGIALELPMEDKLLKAYDAEKIPIPVVPPSTKRAKQSIIERLQVSEADYHDMKAKLLFENFRRLVLEVRGNQTFLDKDGVPIKRTTAKTSLRKIDSAK